MGHSAGRVSGRPCNARILPGIVTRFTAFFSTSALFGTARVRTSSALTASVGAAAAGAASVLALLVNARRLARDARASIFLSCIGSAGVTSSVWRVSADDMHGDAL